MTLGKKQLLRALSLFVVLVAFLGTPYRSMGFDSDCFGVVERASNKLSLKTLFTQPGNACYAATNEAPSDGDYQLYRPLQHVFFIELYKVFGQNAYLYFLLAIIFHVATFCFVYLLYLFIIPDPFAWFLALIAALYPAHTPLFIGLTCFAIPIYFLFVLAVYLCAQFLVTQKFYYYVGSSLLFFVSLFFYEMPLIFPFVLLVYLLLFDYKNSIKNSWLFFCFGGLYVILRFLFIGKKSFLVGGGVTPLQFAKQMIDTLAQSIKPFFGMQDCSWFAVFEILGVFTFILILYLLTRPHDRKKILFYLFAFAAASWPIFLCYSSVRCFYMGIPFFCLILYELLCFVSEVLFKKRNTFFILGVLFLGIGWGGFYTTKCLIRRETYTYSRDVAIRRLARFIKTPHDRFIFLGTLHSFNDQIFLMQTGMVQAVHLLLRGKNIPVYHVTEAKIYGKNSTDAYFDITPVPGGYRFVSWDPTNLFMMCPYGWKAGVGVPFSMGTIIPHIIVDGWKCIDVSFIFDKKWLQDLKHLHIVTWHPEIWDFDKLNADHLGSV